MVDNLTEKPNKVLVVAKRINGQVSVMPKDAENSLFRPPSPNAQREIDLHKFKKLIGDNS